MQTASSAPRQPSSPQAIIQTESTLGDVEPDVVEPEEPPAPEPDEPISEPSSAVPVNPPVATQETAAEPSPDTAILVAGDFEPVCESLSFTVSSTQLLQFLRIDDVVPCDFNGDGLVDLLALNRRVSTGYGYRGIGNGMFAEGPSFDLPFRPAASAGAGAPEDNALLLASSEGTLTLFHPILSEDPPSEIMGSLIDLVKLGGACSDAPLALLDGSRKTAEVYEASLAGVRLLGKFGVSTFEDPMSWLTAILTWSPDTLGVPVISNSLIGKCVLADLDRTEPLDLAYAQRGDLMILQNGGACDAQRIPITGDVVSLRAADVDGNGCEDLVVLLSGGIVDILLCEFGDSPNALAGGAP